MPWISALSFGPALLAGSWILGPGSPINYSNLGVQYLFLEKHVPEHIPLSRCSASQDVAVPTQRDLHATGRAHSSEGAWKSTVRILRSFPFT